jgi:transposase-like protein
VIGVQARRKSKTGKGKRIYSDEDRATALAALDSNGGDLTKTSQAIGVPRRTLADWNYGRHLPPKIAEIRRHKRGSLADELESVAWMLAGRLENEDLLESANLQQVATSLGIVVDKMRLLRGETTENVGLSLNGDVKQDAQDELSEWRQRQQREVTGTARVLSG